MPSLVQLGQASLEAGLSHPFDEHTPATADDETTILLQVRLSWLLSVLVEEGAKTDGRVSREQR